MKVIRSLRLCAAAFFLTSLAASSTFAADPPAGTRAAAGQKAEPEPDFHWQPGPAKIALGHDLDLDLPDSYGFLAMPEAGKLMEKFGNFHNESLLGVIVGGDEKADWIVTVRYEDEGYIKDDEKIDADALLKDIREGTEQGNEERIKRGFAAVHVGDWAEPPRYEKSAHHLVWALKANSDDGTSINYNTRVLGRKGFVSLNLISDEKSFTADRPHAATLLAATRFRPGARYEDFDRTKDKVAEYGLAGLILGGAGLGAAKLVKIGLLAKFGKVILAALIAGKKALVLFLAGIAAWVRRFFGGKPGVTKATGDNTETE